MFPFVQRNAAGRNARAKKITKVRSHGAGLVIALLPLLVLAGIAPSIADPTSAAPTSRISSSTSQVVAIRSKLILAGGQNTVLQQGLSYTRSIASGTTAALTLNQGGIGYLSFYCVIVGTNFACPVTETETWASTNPAGFTVQFNPPTTNDSSPTAEYIAAGATTPPGLYPFTVYNTIGGGGGQSQAYSFYVQVVPSTPGNPAGPYNSAILNKATSWFNNRQSTTAGPKCNGDPRPGSCACAWAVNQILQLAGIAPIGENTDYVPSVEADLKAGRGKPIALANAQPGDIVIDVEQDHIGICATQGCTTAYSNSTSHGAFINATGPGLFHPGTPGRIYRVILPSF